MNTNKLLFLAFFYTTFLFSQSNYVPTGENFTKNVTVPNSPEAAAMSAVGDYNTNMYTGTNTVNLPLGQISGREFSIPIGLNYNASGIPVEQIATWAGLGWNLQAGGTINRINIGKPDDVTFLNVNYLPYYYSQVKNDMNLYPNHIEAGAPPPQGGSIPGYLLFKKRIERGYYETQPDYYTFNAPGGLSGRFFIDYENNIGVSMENPLIKIVPTFGTYYSFKVLVSFTITDTNGTVYEFTERENIKSYFSTPNPSDLNDVEDDYMTYTSSWHLTKIISAEKKDEILFEYYPPKVWVDDQHYNHLTAFKTCLAPLPCTGTTSVIDDSQVYKTEQVLLKEIKINGAKRAEFILSPNERLDIKGSAFLSQIKLFNLKEQNISTTDLTTSYFKTTSSTTNEQTKMRLKLDGITQHLYGQNLNDGIQESLHHVFEYEKSGYTFNFIPDRLSFAQDYWGYYNGANLNTNLVPASSTHSLSGADREPHPELIKVGTLIKITYPTGGSTEFEYDIHKLGSNESGGGIRIDAIKNYTDGNVLTAYKRYFYDDYKEFPINDFENATTAILKQFKEFEETAIEKQSDGSLKTYLYRYAKNKKTKPDNIVTYSKVSELNYGADNSLLGYTVFQFENNENEINNSPYFNESLLNGELKKQEVYSATGELLKSQEVIYDPSIKYSVESKGTNYTMVNYPVSVTQDKLLYNFNDYGYFSGCGVPGYSNCEEGPHTIHTKNNIKLESYWKRPMETIDIDYFNGQGLQTTTNYFYDNPDHRQVTKIVKTGMQGFTHTTEYTYPHDALNQSDPVIVALKNENKLGTLLKMSNKVNDKTSTQEITYKILNNDLIVPDKITAKKEDQETTTIVFDHYDNVGNVLQTSKRAGSTGQNIASKSSYVWGYNKSLLVAKVENASIFQVNNTGFDQATLDNPSATDTSIRDQINTIRNELPKAFVTTYTYSPDIGLTSLTDPKNQTSYFNYDAPNRLTKVKDFDSNILSENEYYYKHVSPNQFQGENYIKNTTYKEDTQNSITNPSATQATVNIQYFDGLGRPKQQIAHLQSGNGKDLITHIEYDNFGRQSKEFLPYVTTNTSLDYRSNAATEVLSFYNVPSFENTTNPYSETFFEDSPLNRPQKIGAPGTIWKGNENNNNDRTIKFDYLSNLGTEVKNFQATTSWNSNTKLFDPQLNHNGNYNARQLYVSITKDENWTSGLLHTKREFKDKKGRVVLKRTYGKSYTRDIISSPNAHPHDTYYVYDEYDNLSYVIPPFVDTSQTISEAVLNGLCYQYKYDQRNRLVAKKLPGKKWEYIVYDPLDRPVATGPAHSPFLDISGEGWLITKYDALNRPVITGWKEQPNISANTRQNLQASIDVQSNYLNEERTTSNVSINGVTVGYTNHVLPQDFHPLTVSYFDDYSYPNAPSSIPSNVEGQVVWFNNTNKKPKGLPTGTWERVGPYSTSTQSHEFSYLFYDKYANPIRVYTKNFINGYTEVDTKFDFTGKVLKTKTKHKRHTNDDELVIEENFEYTPQDRLLKHRHKINQMDEEVLNKNFYNSIGQLISKHVGSDAQSSGGQAPLQNVNYKYNIRGWLTHINDITNLTTSTERPDLFAFKINYTGNFAQDYEGAVDPLYNGNIAETQWRSGNDNVIRSYGYAYDPMNRLTNAIYGKPNASIPITNNYNEWLTYDANGNILTLGRNGIGDAPDPEILIDNLDYHYKDDNSNILIGVNDLSENTAGFNKEEVTIISESNPDYEYDDHGNLIADHIKGMTSISYNHLNLPTKVTFDGTNKFISYLYTATGQKVQKMVKHQDTVSITRYLHGFQYYDTVLQFFHTPEGYVKNTPDENEHPSYDYVYQYKDHLGNVRVNYTQDPQFGELEILEELHYYPFGLQHSNYNNDLDVLGREEQTDEKTIIGGDKPITPFENPGYQYKFGGMELQEEFGTVFYDFGARNYDPALGRWMNIDPLAEMFWSKSPYLFAFNNPVYYIDPDGRSPVINMASMASAITDIEGASSLSNMNQLDSGLLENENVMGDINLGSRNLQNKSNQNCDDCNYNGGELEPVNLGVIKSKKKEEKPKEGVDEGTPVWGNGTEDIGHRVGTRKGSFDTNDFISARSGRSFTNLILKFFQKLFGVAENAEQISTKYGPNRSTMEINNEEPVEVPDPEEYYNKSWYSWIDERHGSQAHTHTSKLKTLKEAKADSIKRAGNIINENRLRKLDSTKIFKVKSNQ